MTAERCQRVLDLVRHLARHFGPGLEAMRALQLLALALEIGSHMIEVGDQPAKLVR